MTSSTCRSSSGRPRSAAAFAPSAITNFFEVANGPEGPSGATGGGYILSKGTTSFATVSKGGGVTTSVNGRGDYDARTTRRAVMLFLEGVGRDGVGVHVEQRADPPIGAGFGSSAAGATSAVYAVAAALGVSKPKASLAVFAHRAEIIERTGAGTVSVIYDGAGAGAVTLPGEPGRARFVRVEVPAGTAIVTAFFAPFDKKDALSSPKLMAKINALGRASLSRFLSDPTLDNLAAEGERFSSALGLESSEVRKAIVAAKRAGAAHASQNMIGYSAHAITDRETAKRVVKALKEIGVPRVDVFGVARGKARVLPT